MQQGGQVDKVCMTADPITGARDNYKVTNVRVGMNKPRADTPDRAAGTVSFKNMGAARRVAFDLRRTPAGWRIDDLRDGSASSLRQQLAPCAAGGH